MNLLIFIILCSLGYANYIIMKHKEINKHHKILKEYRLIEEEQKIIQDKKEAGYNE